VSGIQAHSGLSNGCRTSHSLSELLDLGEKAVYIFKTWKNYAPHLEPLRLLLGDDAESW
jgi:hypothetical protein